MSELRRLRPTVEARIEARQELRAERLAPPLVLEQAEQILMHLAQGQRITHIAAMPDIPAYWVIAKWKREHPWFAEAVADAERAGAEKMLWDMLEIADDENRAPACREVSIKARQFAVKVLDRKRFDPAVKVEVSQGGVNADELSDAELARIVRQRERGQAEAIDAATPGSPPLADPGASKRDAPPLSPPSQKPFSNE